MKIALAAVASLALAACSSAAELVRHISREDPLFNVAASRLAVGRDGKVYLASGEYVLRINRDGSGKLGGKVTYAMMMAAANADGVIATANGHFNHSVNLWSPSFAAIGAVNDFLNNDTVEYFSPCDVEAGASGDFYGLDQNRNRIVRVGVPGRIVTTYPLAGLGEDLVRKLAHFRVWEGGKRFYVLCPSGNLRVIGFDGKLLWSIKPTIGGNPWDGWRGGFDVDHAGRLLILEDTADVVKIHDADGKPAGEIRLRMDKRKGRVSDIRVFGEDLLVKRPDPMELFQVYDRTSGDLRRVVQAAVERLRVGFASDIWPAGEKMRLDISLNPGTPDKWPEVWPSWRMWLRPVGDPSYRQLVLKDGEVEVPADVGGFCDLRIGASINGAADEYTIEGIIEVRKPGATGSISIWTPLNRVYYGQGETIPVRILCRAIKGHSLPATITVRLTDGKYSLDKAKITTKEGKPSELTLPASLTAAMKSGTYFLTADEDSFTTIGQQLIIGPGIHQPPVFSIVQHGDYHEGYPKAGALAGHLARSQALGINLFADRLGSPIGGLGVVDQTFSPAGLTDRARAEPRCPAPEKTVFEGIIRQTLAGFSASGIEERAILLNMDAGLPVGTGFDARKPEQFAEAITKVTKALDPYPSFRGWSWAANWWIGQRGADAARSPEEKAAYQAALKRANETGAWDPILDKASDVWLSHAVNAERQFNAVLQKASPGKLSVMTGPYRAVGVIPPITFRNADEVDLHYQAEQIQPPQVTPHNVDFYKRPGKRAWGHPELWNDDGTGGMIFPTTFQMVMRGADGVGWSGNVGEWASGGEDPRSGGPGTVSVQRNIDTLLKHYGPWLTKLENADRVAIVCSSRMLRIDDWAQIGGRYFDRLFEAYNSCLYAHRPASFVFAEDLKPQTLKKYQAVLVVGQRVQMEPALEEALRAAMKASVRVYHDDTCRPELVKGFTVLGVGFDQVDHDPSAWQDDSAYGRFPAYFKRNAAVLRKVLADVAPVAGCEESEVMLTERRSGDARFVWAVNNVTTGLDPGLAWRVGLMMSQRLPLVTRLQLDAKGQTVYDVFGLRKVTLDGDSVEADLRNLPVRLYAILPAPIAQVRLSRTAKVPAGWGFAWSVSVEDDKERTIRASVPVRVRLLDWNDAVLAEQYTTTSVDGPARGTFTIPLDAPAHVKIEAVELISGKTNWQRIGLPSSSIGSPGIVTPGQKPFDEKPLEPDFTFSEGQTGCVSPEDGHFGPHIKDIAISPYGRMVLLNAFNWDDNLYALDTISGKVRWQKRVGHQFASGPQGFHNGFAVQGFDLHSAEGYHLYLLNYKGEVERRFALYGLPKRATTWAAGAQLSDRINHFAVPPYPSWVASAGDLGLAVWDRKGKLLWSLDWWKTTRKRVALVALGNDTLVTLDGMKATAYHVGTGLPLWEITLAGSGSLLGGVAGQDRRTIALRADCQGGRVFVVREGKLIGTLPTAADDVALSNDGESVVVTTGHQLKWYAADGSLLWTFTGDDVLRNPCLSFRGGRVAVGSELGTLYVLNHQGRVLFQTDLGALPALAWNVETLIAATWMGTVVSYDEEFKEEWRTQLRPTAADVRPRLLADDAVPTTRRTGWGNADEIAAPLTPNLLRETNALITAVSDPPAHGDPRPWQNSVELLRDGKPEPPPKPWLGWTEINYIDSGWRSKLALQVDTFRTQLSVRGITMAEDPAYPESWLRDVRLQYWDAGSEQWRDGPYLLSNAPIHTHRFEKPIEAARFRFISTGGGSWPAGNLRLGELVFHGQALGCSHPDATARRPVAVLFDEREADLACLKLPGRPFAFQYAGAFSGGKCLALTTEGNTLPNYLPPFGHCVPNWDFEIAEKPGPGQYRYLQFAWKALSPKTTGVALLVGPAWPGGGVNVVAGRYDWHEGVIATKQTAEKPPADWEVVRVDLWQLARKPLRIQALGLAAAGGGAAFDQLLLGRTLEDLDRVKPMR
jgi:outer membrane protein assembly factor BamB